MIMNSAFNSTVKVVVIVELLAELEKQILLYSLSKVDLDELILHIQLKTLAPAYRIIIIMF